MLQINSKTEIVRPQVGPRRKQNLRLLTALSLLLIALTVVLVKDRDFWFGSDQALDSDGGPDTVSQTTPAAVPAPTVQSPAAQTAAAKNQSSLNPSTHTAGTGPASKNAANPVPSNRVASNPAVSTPASAKPLSSVVAANRVVLPALDVEVVAGDTHRTVHPGSNVAKVEIPGDSNRASATTTSAANVTTNAAQREALSPVSITDLRQPADSTYPLLGQHTRVQGSVVLQAVIGADGIIENLQVVSGPSILAAAAQQAVRQWHFKPYLQNGQPVETKTTITVNFSIRVSGENPAKAS